MTTSLCVSIVSVSARGITRIRNICLAALLLACSEPESLVRPPVSPPEKPDPPLLGSVLVHTITTGVDVDADGYYLQVRTHGDQRELKLGVNDSVLIDRVPMPEAWLVLHQVAPNCWPERSIVRPVPLSATTIVRVVYVVDCVSAATISTYDRVSGHAASTRAFHGDLSERYVLSADGRFRLQFLSTRWGFFEYLGSYTPSGATAFEFNFGDDARWSAAANMGRDSLSVAYNTIMLLSDFEAGVYVRVR